MILFIKTGPALTEEEKTSDSDDAQLWYLTGCKSYLDTVKPRGWLMIPHRAQRSQQCQRLALLSPVSNS